MMSTNRHRGQGDVKVAPQQECRGRQPFAGARGVLAKLIPPPRRRQKNRTFSACVRRFWQASGASFTAQISQASSSEVCSLLPTSQNTPVPFDHHPPSTHLD